MDEDPWFLRQMPSSVHEGDIALVQSILCHGIHMPAFLSF